VGCGELPDAGRYGDTGSNTLRHTANAVGGLHLPHLQRLGLGNVAPIAGVQPAGKPEASFGKMAESAQGKDSTTGHWEMAGVVLEKEFPTFPRGFPAALLERFVELTGCGGFLGNKTASGTVIIQELGDRHLESGWPIVYTSADSVFQIAAHEEKIPVERLYEMCRITRESVCVGEWGVGRVIARPFVGTSGAYRRTTNRKDFSLSPPGTTVLDELLALGVETVSVGKVDDLFAGRGISTMHHTRTNGEGIACIVSEAKKLGGGLIFANLGDFDTLYGHRNDPAGFAKALEVFDDSLPDIRATLRKDDLLIITADHGNDPVMPSTDHTREYAPLLCLCSARETGADLGIRRTFSDVGKTIAQYFGLRDNLPGTSFLDAVRNQ
jgi:phosphopentomutase